MDESEEYYELSNMLGFCGCGSPDEAMLYVGSILKAIEARTVSDWKVNAVGEAVNLSEDHPAFWVIWYHLDSRGLLQHGTGIRGSWLTDKGKEALRLCRIVEKQLHEQEAP